MEYSELVEWYDARDWHGDPKFHVIKGEYGWDVFPPLKFWAQDYNMWGAPTWEMAMEYAHLFSQIAELNRQWYD